MSEDRCFMCGGPKRIGKTIMTRTIVRKGDGWAMYVFCDTCACELARQRLAEMAALECLEEEKNEKE